MMKPSNTRLNPCFSGRWSLTHRLAMRRKEIVLILVLVEDGLWRPWGQPWLRRWISRLNPCFSGRWSLTFLGSNRKSWKPEVLILVLMEDGLWRIIPIVMNTSVMVLILVLMEDGLWQVVKCMMETELWSLNPCFNGRWSLTVKLAENLKEPNLS